MILKTAGNGNFVLPATAVLGGLSEQLASRHRDLGLRHPLGVYNTSIAVIAKRVDRVLSLLRVVVPEADSGGAGSPEKHVDELLESQEALLHGLMQHMDDCINILRGFTVERRAFNENHHVKAYRRAVQEYRAGSSGGCGACGRRRRRGPERGGSRGELVSVRAGLGPARGRDAGALCRRHGRVAPVAVRSTRRAEDVLGLCDRDGVDAPPCLPVALAPSGLLLLRP